MSPSPNPRPASSSDPAFAHPSLSLSSLSDLPSPRLTPGRPRSWRNRRRQAWLGAGDHGSATLLNAHRPGPTPPPPAA